MRKLFYFLMLFSSIGWAQTFTGNGDGSSWNDPDNWSTNSVPLMNGDTSGTITIPAGMSAIIADDDILTQSSGTINGPGEIINNGVFNLSFGGYTYFQSSIQFTNKGTFNVGDEASGNYIFYFSGTGSELINETTGIINMTKRDISYSGSIPGNFVNNGIINKSGNFTASINVPLTNYATIEVEENKLSLKSTTQLNGGTYNISEDAVLSLEGNNYFEGILTGNATGKFNLTGSNYVEENKTVVNQISGTGITQDSGTLSGPGNFQNDTKYTINFGSYTYFQAGIQFTNNGTFNVGDETSGNYIFYISGTGTELINEASGIINLFRRDISYSGSIRGNIVNNGTINKSSDFPASINIPLTNNATIEVEENKLSLKSTNQLNDGTYNISEDAVLSLEGNNYFEGILIGNAVGKFNITGSNYVEEDKTVVNQISGSGITQDSGTLSGPGIFQSDTKYTINFSSYTYFQAGIKFNNEGTFNVGDETSGNYIFYISGTGTELINEASGIINLFRRDISYSGSIRGNIVNNGTINKSANFPASINVPLTNNATIEVEENKLSLKSTNYLNGGTYNISEDAVLSLEGNNYFEGILTGNATGKFNLTGSNYVEDEKTVVNQISGTGITQNSGTLSGPGIFQNDTKYTINFSSYTYFQAGIQFTNNGTFNVGDETSGNYIFYISGTGTKLINEASGVFNLFRRDISYSGSILGNIVNKGTIKKSEAFDMTIGIPLSNENTGTISIEDGSLYLSRSFHNKEDGLIEGTKIKFNNASNLTNEGRLNPGLSPGKMIIETFFSMDGGVLEFELDGLIPETEYDVIEFAGSNSVNLNGDIQVTLGFDAAIGDSFTVFNMTSTNNSHVINANLPTLVIDHFEGWIYEFEVEVTNKQIILNVTDKYPEPCDVPEDVTLISKDYEQATFSWSAAEETSPIGYEYYIGLSPDIPATATGTTDSNTFQVTETGLQDYTDYYIRVRTNCDWDNFSDWSETVSFKTDPLPCDDPTNLMVSGITHNAAHISWNGGNGSSWQLVYGTDISDPDDETPINLSSDEYDFTNLESFTEYTVYIKSVCEHNESDWVSTTFTTNHQPCDAVANLDYEELEWNQYKITWDAGDAVSWTVSVNGGTGVQVTQPEYGMNELLPLETYTVSVVANCEYHDSDPAVTEFTTENEPCDAVTGLQHEELDWNEYKITWNAGDADSWTVSVNGGAGVQVTQPEYTMTNLQPLETYTVSVVVNCEFTSSGPETTSFTTENEPCDAVTDLQYQELDWDEYKITWTSDADSWTVYVNGDAGTTVTDPEYTMTGLGPELTYTVEVVAHCTSGNSGPKSTEFTTGLEPCDAVTGLQSEEMDWNEYKITWNAGDADSWTVSVNGGTGIQVSQPEYLMDNLEPSETYSVSVVVNCSTRDSDAETTEFTTGNAPVNCDPGIHFISHVSAYNPGDANYMVNNTGYDGSETDYSSDSSLHLVIDRANPDSFAFTFRVEADGGLGSANPDLDYQYEIWIDRNQDGLFENGEYTELFYSGGSNIGYLEGSFDLEDFGGCNHPQGTFQIMIKMNVYDTDCDETYSESEIYLAQITGECSPDPCSVDNYYISYVYAAGPGTVWDENETEFDTHTPGTNPAITTPVTTPGYGDYSNIVYTLNKSAGDTFSFQIKSEPADISLNFHYDIWVDRNDDGILSNDGWGNYLEHLINIDIPGGDMAYTFDLDDPILNNIVNFCEIPNRDYPLRIIMTVYDENCQMLYGETEDYTLRIEGDCNDRLSVDTTEFNRFNFYPNPVNSTLNLDAAMPIQKVEIFNLLGQRILEVNPDTDRVQLDTQSLSSGVYMMKVNINGKEKSFKLIKK